MGWWWLDTGVVLALGTLEAAAFFFFGWVSGSWWIGGVGLLLAAITALIGYLDLRESY